MDSTVWIEANAPNHAVAPLCRFVTVTKDPGAASGRERKLEA